MRIFAAFAGLLALVSLAPAQDQPRDQEEIGPNLNNVNLHVLTEAVQRKTKKAFLWSNDVNLKQKYVHFKSDIELDDPEVLFRVYQHILEISGFVLVPVGEGDKTVYKVVPNTLGMKKSVPIVTEMGELNDQFVTRLFSLKYITPRDVHAALINMAFNPQSLFPIDSAGIIMITDYDYNIARFEKIIATMDVKKPDIELRMVQLKNALASDLETLLNSLVQTLVQRSPTVRGRAIVPGQSQQEQVKIAADRRTNSLVILATLSRMEQILELVAKLDSEAGFETSGIYIMHLRHTNAVDIVKTLNAMYGVSTDDSGAPGGTGVRPGQTTGPPGRRDQPVPGGGGAGAQAAIPTIVADLRSNSVIVVTDRNTYRTIEGVVQRLDQRRPQVLIKATVVEVRATDDFDFGVELNALFDPAGTDKVAGFGRNQFQQSTFIVDPVSGEPSILPVDTTGITLGILKDRWGNLAGMLKAFEGKAKVSILDEPEAATVDNGTAEMRVTNQVPILQTTITGTGIAQTTFSRFETAETTLSISPHISESGYLRLDATVKIEKFVKGGQTDPTIPPPKTGREIKTNSIVVPNGRTVVIGGIRTQDESDSVQGTPFLSDIPIIGLLFSREQKNVEQRTLYIFITPYILYDDNFGDFKDLTAERKDAIEVLRKRPIDSLNLEVKEEPGAQSLFQFAGARKEEE